MSTVMIRTNPDVHEGQGLDEHLVIASHIVRAVEEAEAWGDETGVPS